MSEAKRDKWSGDFTIFNMGCEYANFSLEKHFKGVADEKEILRSLKEWELETRLISTQPHFKMKYEFVPLETH